ncbi:MAG: coenzyme F420-reducing hydrogenase, FrhD protein [Thermoplasmata archaeon]|nr:MAG: coenzyme F420-reducing hydrogenase, FrhD protein [Thermoplasmata archaeon]
MPEYHGKSVLILGCGNILFGDDGFGPAVVEELEREYDIPDHVYVINAGLSVRELLFNITLDEEKPDRIIIVDAVDFGSTPGELFEIDLDEIPENKIDDFSMHQMPTSNLLRELRDLCGVDVRILSCQVVKIPEFVEPGLSDTLKNKVKEACELIVEKYFKLP